MLKVLRRLASLKITLIGMVLLIIGSVLIYGNPVEIPTWVVVVPLVFLATNLTAAILTNNRINHQPDLLVFHVCLLGLVILAGVGRLTHLDAHTELPIATEFSSERLLEVRAGVWHGGKLDKVSFIQGPFTVQYEPGVRRGLTHSHVMVKDNKGRWEEQVVGDDRPLILEGYRFYTTHNKGFTTILTWTPLNGEPISGTLNMPSYPLFEYKQDNRWTPPGSKEIKFWLQIKAGLDETKDWVLDARNSSAVLVVTTGEKRKELNLGDSVLLPGGELKFEKLTMWMGYRIFYDPTIQWMFYVSIAGILGLGFYFWRKINLQPWLEETENETDNRQQMALSESKHSKQIQKPTSTALPKGHA